MEHKTIDQLSKLAILHSERPGARPLSQRERLVRWALLLERCDQQYLRALPGTEHRSAEARNQMRWDGSPLTVAFLDPVLREDGLRDDTYGEAKRFFGLSDWQLHRIVCYCHYGATMSAKAAAWRLRAQLAEPKPDRLTRIRQALAL